MSDRVWHKGPPPFQGWWNASVQKDDEAWRWWEDGEWSVAAYDYDCAEEAQRLAEVTTNEIPSSIEWTDYWPENARVPRLDPGRGWIFNVDGKPPENVRRVDLVFRDGRVLACQDLDWRWTLKDQQGDIVAWRPA